MSSELIQPNVPVKFSARNPYPRYTRLRGGGDCYKLIIEVEEATWNQLKTLPIGAILECLIWYHDGDSPDALDVREAEEKAAKPKKDKKPKGEHGRYWQAMFRAGFNFNHDLLAVLELEDGSLVKERLKDVFEFQSLTFCSPQLFEAWAEQKNLHSLVTLSRQTAAKVGL